MVRFPELPPGSSVLTKVSPGRLAVGWQAEPGRQRLTGTLIVAAWAVAWLALAVGIMILLLWQRGFTLETAGPLFFFVVFVIMGAGVTWQFVRPLASLAHCECLVLGHECIAYLEGMRPGGSRAEDAPWRYSFPCIAEFFWIVWKVNRLARLERAEVREVRLGERGGGRRVVLDLGERVLEIGELLTDPEREWLAEVLRCWRDGETG